MEYKGTETCAGDKRNPNLNIDQSPLVFGKEAKNQAWGHNLRDDIMFAGKERPDSWWTGCRPVIGECPGVLPDGTVTSLPLPCVKKHQFTRKQVVDYFDNTWTLTEVLFSALQTEEAFYRPPYHELRHPFIFYYGHVAVLYVNKLRVAGIITEAINPQLEQLMETGVDEMSWDDMSKNNEHWPAVSEVTEYRRKVYQIVSNVLRTHPALDGSQNISFDDPAWAIFLGFEHERIHIETTSVLMRELPLPLLRHPPQWPKSYYSSVANAAPTSSSKPVAGKDYPINSTVHVQGEEVLIGRGGHLEPESFGWDNEFGQNIVPVPSFEAQKFLCTNGEVWEFVRSGGYSEQKWWTAEGWSWRCFRNAKWPTFWVPDGPQGLHQYKLRLCFEIIPMQWSYPAVVNRHEAKAYCNWLSFNLQKNCRIPTEAEHRLMRGKSLKTVDPVLKCRGDQLAKEKGLNLNLGFSSESAVDAFPSPSLDTTLHDTMGNLWVWCEDWFCPLKGFKVSPIYDDFSTPCFDNKHAIIMGGSFISTGNEASIWARFHFRPHFFQQAGFRVIISETSKNSSTRPLTTDQLQSKDSAQTTGNVYESTTYLQQYLGLHFGTLTSGQTFSLSLTNNIPSNGDKLQPLISEISIPFPKRAAQLATELCRVYSIPFEKAFDLGCAVGGSTFELAREFKQVLGIDLSESFISAANQLKGSGELSYVQLDEGELTTKMTATVGKEIDRTRVTFKVGDACCLPPDLGSFNLVVACNLIDRLPSPKACLGRMGGAKGIVVKGGLLLNLSPYTWMESFTPKGAWLGGYLNQAGQEVSTKDGIQKALGEEFELLYETNVPLLIREHSRKFQFIVSHATVWKRR